LEVSRFESITLIGAVIGAAVLDSGPHSLGAGSTAAGNLAILLALFAFDGTEARSSAQSIAFGGASGFCLLAPVFFLGKTILGVTPPADTSPWFIVGAWLIGTLIMFAVDRFRMSSKEDVSLGRAGLAGAPPTPIISSAPPLTYRPAPIRVEPVQPPPPPAPVYTPPPVAYAPPPPPPPAPVAPVPTFVTQPPVPEFSATSFANPVVQAVPAPPPAPDILAIPPGREAVIYLNLVGEGLNVLRTVRAENLGRDYYRIADIMPEGEQWEFTPGQVVKCRKKALSNGKHMVAYEEAPRA